MATANNKEKKEKVYDVLTRYGIMDRQTAITAKGIMVYVPARCIGNAIQTCPMI